MNELSFKKALFGVLAILFGVKTVNHLIVLFNSTGKKARHIIFAVIDAAITVFFGKKVFDKSQKAKREEKVMEITE